MTTKTPLHEGLMKQQMKKPAQDGALKPSTATTQTVKPAGAPPKPAPLPNKK